MSKTTDSFPDLLQRFIGEMNASGVDYVVCGGVACMLQGTSRITADVDVSVRLDQENLERLLLVARNMGLQPRIPEPIEALLDESRRREWIERKNAMVYTLVSKAGDFQVDVFLRYPIPHGELRKRADLLGTGRLTMPVSSKADLIAAKQQVLPLRKIDQRDIEDLQELISRERER